jgi:hypothetical protein
MTITANMLSEISEINSKINTEMKSLNNLFENNGWKIENNGWKIENKHNFSEHIIYSKPGRETEFFKFEFDNDIIDINNTNIYVSVPLKNSNFQYKTKFVDYYSAIKYTESKFNYFIDNEISI